MPLTGTPVLRIAVPGDADAVRAIVQAAYEPWIPVIGMRPLPLEADYDQLIEAGSITVLVEPGAGAIAALIVLVLEAEALLIENVAVECSSVGVSGGSCWPTPRTWRGARGWRPSGSTPTD